MSLTEDEIDRYARHIVLREIGGPGQQSLKKASVLVIGAGGLGSPALMYLAAAGIGRIVLVDDDEVSLSNLQRQIVHGTPDIGVAKTESAARSLSRLNPHVELELRSERLTKTNAQDLLASCDLVVDGCDNFDTRFFVNEIAAERSVPLVFGAISQWEGQVSLFAPATGTPCYACIFPKAPAPGLAPSCAEAGVVGALAGVIGSIMATEAIKWITGAGAPLTGHMLIYDALWGESRKIRLTRRDDCPVCGKGGS